MARTRRKNNSSWSPRPTSQQTKWLVPLVASMILLVLLWADHGSLAEDGMSSNYDSWRGVDARGSQMNKPSPLPPTWGKASPPPALLRQTLSQFREFDGPYDGQRPLLIENGVKWKAIKEWSRKRFVNAYQNEMLVLTMTRAGLHNREVMVAPVKELNRYAQNNTPEEWALVEDELFLVLRESLMKAVGDLVYTEDNLFSLFPENCRPANLTLLWGSNFARSVLRVPNFNATAVHVLLRGQRRWKLFPPSQSAYLHLEQGGVTSGLGLQCRAYASPVDAFGLHSARFPRFAGSHPLEFEQNPGEVVIVPPGWFAQWLSVNETLGTMTPVLNKHNFEIVLSEILKIRDQVHWNQLPLDLDSLAPEEQIKIVMGNLVDAVHWRADVTRSAMMMQFGRHLHQGDVETNQPLKMLQDAIMSNPHLMNLGVGSPSTQNKPAAQEQCLQDTEAGPVISDSSLQALYNAPLALLEALGDSQLMRDYLQ